MSIEVETKHQAVPSPCGARGSVGGGQRRVTHISPRRGWQLVNVRELWRFRELVYYLVWRDVKVRYKQAVLGAAWAVLQPLMMMIVFSILFSRLAGFATHDLPYPLFAFAGLLPWTFFAGAVGTAAQSLLNSERLITKIYFPRLAVPLAAVGASVVDFLIALGLLFALMGGYALAGYRVAPGIGLLLVPVVFGILLLAAVGLGTLLSALSVVYRDVRHVVPFMLQLWMFATPAIYMQRAQAGAGAAGGWFEALLALNPLNELIGAFRAACLGGPIHWGRFAVASACVVGVFVVGCLYFRRVENSFADII